MRKQIGLAMNLLMCALCFFLGNIESQQFSDERIESVIAPFLLPADHPIKATLDHLFAQSRVTENMSTLTAAGFEVIAAMPRSYVIVARHPAVVGYVFKLYLDAETRTKDNAPHWLWLSQRCIGAFKIREMIAYRGIKHFFVPEKWIYVLPTYPVSKEATAQPIIVVAQDIEPFVDAKEAWKTRVTKELLDELYIIMKWGYSTTQIANIPYTQSGKFAFMDTEYPCRGLHLGHIEKYLSKEMAAYWKDLLEKEGEK